MERSESIAQLSAALAKAQSELKNPQLTKFDGFLNRHYAPLEEYYNALRPIGHHGLCYVQNIVEAEEGIYAQTLISHESGEWLLLDGPLIPVSRQAKKPAQERGSCSTYAKRYAIATAFGLFGEEDTDASDTQDDLSESTKASLEVLRGGKETGEAARDQLLADIQGAETKESLWDANKRIKQFLDAGNAQFRKSLQDAFKNRLAALEGTDGAQPDDETSSSHS